MQQTKTYKLNLIEKTDTFSPDPLNENAQKLETALDTKFAALDAGSDALDTRVTALEAHKVAVGIYTGNGAAAGQEINLGFYPRIVFIQPKDSSAAMATRIRPYNGGILTLTENGFKVCLIGNTSMNGSGGVYTYCAIL